MTELVDGRKNPDEEYQTQELEGVITDVIADLPEKYPEVFVLSALQHLSYEQIAILWGAAFPA